MSDEITSINNYREKLQRLSSERELCILLDVKYSSYTYFMYGIPRESQYKEFNIKKKNGGKRKIAVPVTGLKSLQKSLIPIFDALFWKKPSVYGFVKGKNIVQHARLHSHRKFVFSCDIKDFFPSIHFGRIYGMLISPPYLLNPTIAKAVARMTTYRQTLPQGAPSSPILSNMIAAHMDTDLQRLAKKYKCFYSRYADDITFSTNLTSFPIEIAHTKDDNGIACDHIKKTIEKHGFTLNPEKSRLHPHTEMQSVTGLTVNEFPNVKRKYVRQVRAMLHAWRKFGLEACQKEFTDKYSQSKNRKTRTANFKRVLFGKINFIKDVKGMDNQIYLKYAMQYYELAKGIPPAYLYITYRDNIGDKFPQIRTEGKTDWKHFKAALRALKNEGLFLDLKISFFDSSHQVHHGDGTLHNFCNQAKYGERRKGRCICIFDRDKEYMVKKTSGQKGDFNYWGNNVYSFPIPCPSHRSDKTDAISTELYFTDSELTTLDSNNRRFFLSSEFDHETGILKTNGKVAYQPNKGKKNKQKGGNVIIDSRKSIITEKVFHNSAPDKNIALSKNAFAQNILLRKKEFANFDFIEFIAIFEMVERIIKHTPPK